MMSAPPSPIEILRRHGATADKELPVADIVLAFAALDRPQVNAARYHSFVRALTKDISARHQDLIAAGADEDAGTQLAALRDVILHDRDFVTADMHETDPVDQINLFAAIDTRAAHPALLAGIFIMAAQTCGWQAELLSVPDHFIVRLTAGGTSLIFDPGQDCRLLQAHDVRALVKESRGQQAELSASYFNPLPQRDMILNIQNVSKLHRITIEDYDAALGTVQAMQALAPDEYRLLLDAGVLYARTRQTQAAIFALDHYIAKAPDARSRAEAQLLLDDLKGMSS